MTLTNPLMKRFCLVTLLISVSYFTVNAQKGVKIGLQLTPIISFARILDTNGDQLDEIDGDARLGLSYGLTLNYGFTDNYGFHTGFHIVNKGFTRTQTILDTEARQRIRITSIEIPAALKLRTNQITDGFHIHGIFGLAFEANVGYRNRFTGLDPRVEPFLSVEESGTIRDEDLIKNLAVSFIFGPGAEYDLGVGIVNFGFIFHQMLTNLNNLNSYGVEERIRINYISFEIGYTF